MQRGSIQNIPRLGRIAELRAMHSVSPLQLRTLHLRRARVVARHSREDSMAVHER
jgi:hypothetical protein